VLANSRQIIQQVSSCNHHPRLRFQCAERLSISIRWVIWPGSGQCQPAVACADRVGRNRTILETRPGPPEGSLRATEARYRPTPDISGPESDVFLRVFQWEQRFVLKGPLRGRDWARGVTAFCPSTSTRSRLRAGTSRLLALARSILAATEGPKQGRRIHRNEYSDWHATVHRTVQPELVSNSYPLLT